MGSTKEFQGRENLTGRKFGTLIVDRLATLKPEPSWFVRCERCGTQNMRFSAVRLRANNARCVNIACGKVPDETLQQYTARLQREAQASADAKKAKEDARIMEIEAQLRSNSRKLREVRRDTVQTQRDPDVLVDNAARMTIAEAQAYNNAEADRFLASTPEYHRSDANFAQLSGYFARNGLSIISESMLRAAFLKLRDLGLLEERPAPAPAPAPVQPTYRTRRQQAAEEPPPTKATFTGIDLETGLAKEYTNYQVNAMSADTFRRVFQINTAPAPFIAEGRLSRETNK